MILMWTQVLPVPVSISTSRQTSPMSVVKELDGDLVGALHALGVAEQGYTRELYGRVAVASLRPQLNLRLSIASCDSATVAQEREGVRGWLALEHIADGPAPSAWHPCLLYLNRIYASPSLPRFAPISVSISLAEGRLLLRSSENDALSLSVQSATPIGPSPASE